MDSEVQDLSDLDLINLIKTNADSRAFEELLDRHTGIYLDTLYKYSSKASELINQQDFIEDTNSNIYEAVLKYDPARGAKFSTYLGNSTRWKCLNTVNKNKKKPTLNFDSMTKVISEKYLSEESFIKNLTRCEIYDILKSEIDNQKDERIKTIFYMRYFNSGNKPTPWRKIAEKLNLSIQGVIDIHDRFLITIRKKHELQ